MPAARRAGKNVVSSEKKYAATEMRITFSHGITNSTSGSSTRNSSMRLTEETSPSTGPRPMPSTAMKEDSARKLNWTMPREKPIARSTPIPCRRSTTARALMTPKAAMPTNRPSAMKPKSRLKSAF